MAFAAGLTCVPAALAMSDAVERPTGQFPTTAAEAIALDEGDVGDWADGPMSLFILEGEEEIWDGLENDAQRRRFIGWFWARRDEDLRDNVHPIKMETYGRVAEANKRFTELPRGWRTDRGRVWVMFGRPTTIRSDFEDENTTWNYFAPGLGRQLAFDNAAGEFDVYFSRQRPRSYRIAGGVAPGVWPAYVLRVMEFVRQGLVVNPDLKWTRGAD
jgi:GWxTD domain-containing protein